MSASSEDWSPVSVSFWEIVFANWSFEELSFLTAGMDAWLPRDDHSRRV